MYVAMEGVSFSGKSTQIKRFIKNNPDWIATREPGGTPMGLELEQLLKTQEMSDRTRKLLLLADRSHHIDTVVAPVINAGRSVISDRSLISGFSYVAADAGSKPPLVSDDVLIEQLSAADNVLPDKVIMLKHMSLSSLLDREPDLVAKDMIERKGGAYLMDTQSIMIYNLHKFCKQVHIYDADLAPHVLEGLIDQFIFNK